jgi:hypothetical protein
VIPVADFNASGHQGVFLYDSAAGVGYAGLGNGSGLFTYVYSDFTPGFDTIRYGDFNGDGKADLIVSTVHPLRAMFCSAMATARFMRCRCSSGRDSTISQLAT